MKRYLLVFLVSVLVFPSCSTVKLARVMLKTMKPPYAFVSDSIPPAPDYNEMSSWFLHQNSKDKDIDVFYIHPTSYKVADNWNQPMTDEYSTKRTERKAIKAQALMFDSIANIYAPRYRQATFYSFLDKDSNGTKALDLAYEDVLRSFEYFLEKKNDGKPFMITGHSQGSLHAMRMLNDEEIQEKIGDKLIVAYLIGWPFSDEDIVNTPYSFCQDSTDLNCIISWNSQKKHSPVTMKVYKKGEDIYSINPLSWSCDDEYYDKSYNKGAYLVKGNNYIERPNYIGARNYKGILAIDKPKDKEELGIPKNRSNYHVQDIAFFYFNMKENAELRKKVYLESTKQVKK